MATSCLKKKMYLLMIPALLSNFKSLAVDFPLELYDWVPALITDGVYLLASVRVCGM